MSPDGKHLEAPSGGGMGRTTALILDRSNPVFAEWVRGLAPDLGGLGIDVLFVSDKEPSGRSGNLEIVNIRDVPQRDDLRAIEDRLGVSLHRALVPERAFFDYTSMRRCQTYSRMSLDRAYETVLPYVNAFDYLVRERADMVVEGLADNFMTSVVGRVAKRYGKPFYMAAAYYWWSDGLFFFDRLDQTSSAIDRRYAACRANPALVDRRRVEERFAEKRSNPRLAVGTYPLSQRLRQLIARRTSYEPLSLCHWVCRRAGAVLSRALIGLFARRERAPAEGEDYLVFPMHVAPEATLLGTMPELADQLGLIKNMSMNLPAGVRLYVKEHPAQRLGTGFDFRTYRQVSALPNVRWLRADAHLDPLLGNPRCLGVAVINGTLGLEAAIRRLPVFVFGRAIYGAADCFIKPADFEDFARHIMRIRRGAFVFDELALYAMLQALDETVVRAPVDSNNFDTIREWVLASNPIYREFFRRALSEGGL